MRAMKDSGIEWIGNVPETWRITKISDLYRLRNEKVSDKDYQPLSVTKKGILPQLATAAKSDDGDNRKLVKKGDFAINSRSDRRGSCGISSYDGSVSLINTILTPREEMNPDYYNWMFHSSLFSDEFYRYGHGIVDDLWTTRWQEMKRISVLVPTLAEQQRIADFLDEKCADIDTAISEAKASIEDYKLLKQSIITKAVTKGLNPNAEMKDSGIEWIGKVPKEWTPTKIKYVAKVSPTINIDYDNNAPMGYVPMECVKNGSMSYKTIIGEHSSGLVEFQNGDIIMAKVTPCFENGNIAIADKLPQGVAIGSSELFVFRTNREKIDSAFLCWYLQNDVFKGHAIARMTGTGGLKRVSPYFIKNLPLFIPSLNEQDIISEYLNDKCSTIDTLISEKEQIISELEAYKKSLIFEYVTGKKEVV